MTVYEAAKKALDEGVQQIKHRRGNQYDCKDNAFQGHSRGWVWLDTFTASAIVQVFENLKPENQEKYMNLPLPRLIDATWKCMS